MANLTVEGLNRIVQTGDAESLVGTRRLERQEMPANPGAGSSGGSTFSDILKNSMEQVNEHQQQADTAIKELVAGRTKNIHETMLAIERADTSLKLMMQVRNKILDAYKEIMRMQV